MNDFLDRYQVPKLNQDQINHLNNPITPKEIEAVIRSLSTKKKKKKAQGQMVLVQNSIIFKEDLIPIFLKLFHKIETEGALPNSFYEATVTLIPKPQKDPRKKENYRPISLIKFSQAKSKNTSKQSSIMTK